MQTIVGGEGVPSDSRTPRGCRRNANGALWAPRLRCRIWPDYFLCLGFLPFTLTWKVCTVGLPPSFDL